MSHLKHTTDKDWRAFAKEILVDLRKYQDQITAKHGLEGFSMMIITIDGALPDKVLSVEFRSEPGYCVISRLEDGCTVDTFNVEIPI